MRRASDLAALTGGLVTVALGALLALDAAGVIRLSFGWLWPALLAAVGAILVASGLAQRDR
ncbi:MAG TPA: hypothetical protein VK279_02965 [Solirubrobacteraceae bacterium]|nr:hypothetical protein [Solirubrobacteraceae bacterium]